MNINKLKGRIVEKEYSVESLAHIIGLDKATLYRKLSNPDKFTLAETVSIKKALDINDQDAIEIFLS